MACHRAHHFCALACVPACAPLCVAHASHPCAAPPCLYRCSVPHPLACDGSSWGGRCAARQPSLWLAPHTGTSPPPLASTLSAHPHMPSPLCSSLVQCAGMVKLLQSTNLCGTFFPPDSAWVGRGSASRRLGRAAAGRLPHVCMLLSAAQHQPTLLHAAQSAHDCCRPVLAPNAAGWMDGLLRSSASALLQSLTTSTCLPLLPPSPPCP